MHLLSRLFGNDRVAEGKAPHLTKDLTALQVPVAN